MSLVNPKARHEAQLEAVRNGYSAYFGSREEAHALATELRAEGFRINVYSHRQPMWKSYAAFAVRLTPSSRRAVRS